MMGNTNSSKILAKAFEFEKLCARIFRSIGLVVEEHVIVDTTTFHQLDLVLTGNNKVKVAVEIKFYRTRKPNKIMLEKAITRIKEVAQEANIERHMIVVGGPVDDWLKDELLKSHSITIVDSNNLLYLIDKNDELLNEFYDLMSDIPVASQEEEKTQEIDLHYLFDNSIEQVQQVRPNIPNIGQALCNEIKAIKCGNKTFATYEDKCMETLKYLFDENLNGWHKQLRTDDGLNRYDLICRVKRGNEFWELLINEFHSRYIVFEFKNYCDKIKQTQVYTTEKYLFQKALRNVCFMISRKGLDNNALLATKGILRESGKLIINLNDEDIYKMLYLKEVGEEPSDYLFELLDDILLKLSK